MLLRDEPGRGWHEIKRILYGHDGCWNCGLGDTLLKMVTLNDSYSEYARVSLANHANKDAISRYRLFDAVKDQQVKMVLDVGCGAGQDLVPFIEKTPAFCVGIDIATELGKISKEVFAEEKKVAFVRSEGERLPFASRSFDVVLCRVALPYMDNTKAIAEVARILKPNGVYLLKTHTPKFYLAMIRNGLKTFNLKKMAYPIICLAGSGWQLMTNRKLKHGIWEGKEVFQTQRFLERQFRQNGLQTKGFLSDDNPLSRSYHVVKM